MVQKINKILVANRGEIAVRVIKTCRRLGISVVAVYSDADASSVAVSMADEVYYLGESLPSKSYLDVDKILEAARVTGADAIHPGYGFLSENHDFARRITEEGLIFIGPHSEAIKQMGDKITSKIIARKAGVSTIPGCDDIVSEVPHAQQVARDIGYPVLLKASAGGGGKGIRICYDDNEVAEMLPSVIIEGEKSFGDGRIFVEKYIEQPRHIEIQIIADKHGNVICCGERECSIQRKHQKVIEEAPSVSIDPQTREKMYEQARLLAQNVGYDSAGTVEMVMGRDGGFYFLEMNTRLQVEHPVTEYITGLDLVELMIKSAEGEKMPITQDDINLKGHAIEVRICAENPSKNFLPSTGWIESFVPPEKTPNIRFDTGFREGYYISAFYDSMIAKLIVYGKDRSDAIHKLRDAMSQTCIKGFETNMQFVNSIIFDEDYFTNNLSVNFIKEKYPNNFKVKDPEGEFVLPMVMTAILIKKAYLDSMPFKNPQEKEVCAILRLKDGSIKRFNFGRNDIFENGCTFVLDGKQHSARIAEGFSLSDKICHVHINDKDYRFQFAENASKVKVCGYSFQADVFVLSSDLANYFEICQSNQSEAKSATSLDSPIGGTISEIYVNEGETVQEGDKLLIIEAMKMQNIITAESTCVIEKISCTKGESVMMGDILMKFKQ